MKVVFMSVCACVWIEVLRQRVGLSWARRGFWSELWHLFNWRVTALFSCWHVSCIACPVGRAEKVAGGPSHLPLGMCSSPSSLPWGMWNLFLGFIFFWSFHRQCVGKLRAVAVGITSLFCFWFFFFVFWFESLLKWHFKSVT